MLAGVAVLALVASACGGGDSKAATPKSTTTTVAPTTTTVAIPVAPLTGLQDPAGASLTRPALSVKVENTEEARPQTGIDQADVVYEEVVESNITRFVAVFNSTVPDVIGPVRSVRAEDPDIVWPLGGIFAYSGGAPVNVDAINAAPVERGRREQPRRPGAQRAEPASARRAAQPVRPRPSAVRRSGGQPVPPKALFEYLPAGSGPVAGPRHPGVPRGLRARATTPPGRGTAPPAPGSARSRACPRPSSAARRSHRRTWWSSSRPYGGEAEAQTVGEGDVWIFSDGTVRPGRWVRPDKTQPARYVDSAGATIPLHAGRTWVELLPVGSAVDLVDRRRR